MDDASRKCRHDEIELDVRIASLCDALESEKRFVRILRMKLADLHDEFLRGKRCICGTGPHDDLRCDVGDLIGPVEAERSALSAREAGAFHSPEGPRS